MTKTTIRNNVKYKNIATKESEAFRFMYSLQEAMGTKMVYFNFIKGKNGRYASKYVPNISLEFKSSKYADKEGLVLLIYDEVNKTTAMSKFVKRIIDYCLEDKPLTLPFSLDDLNNDLGFTNYSNNPSKKFSNKYLLMKFKDVNRVLQFKFQYKKENEKNKLSFEYVNDEKRKWRDLTMIDQNHVKTKFKGLYEEFWGLPLDLKNSDYCKF